MIDEQTCPISERMKFNCYQVSPCISSIIHAPTLVQKKTKTISYSLDKNYLNRTRSFIRLYDYFQSKLDNQEHKPSKSLPKISSFHLSASNPVGETQKIDNLEKAVSACKNMKNLATSLKKHEQRFSSMASSKIILENAKIRGRAIVTAKILKEIEEEEDLKKKEAALKPTIENNINIPKAVPLKLGLLETHKIMRSFRDKEKGDMTNTHAIRLKNQSSFSPISKLEGEKMLDSAALSNISSSKNPKNKVNLQPLINEKERIKAKIYEKGEVIDINESLNHRVKTFFMLNSIDDKDIADLKERKKEYVNKYGKLISQNINENIKKIKNKLEELDKKQKKILSFHL